MQILEIKSQLSILTVLSHYGIQPDRNHRLHCPFHTDRTPSMQVYPKTNTVYCFSTNCKLHGKSIDQIDFILHQESCTKHQAILKAKSLIKSIASQATPSTITTPKPTTMIQNKKDLPTIFAKLRSSLHRSKRAIDYLKSRHLYDAHLEIGYNHYQTDFKHLRNCVVFPLKDPAGNIASLYGRSLGGDKAKAHYYLKDRSGLYPGYPKKETKVLIITEAIIDAATLLKYTSDDTYDVLSLYGVNGWGEEHAQAIEEWLTPPNFDKGDNFDKEVIFFMDGDEAGRKACERYALLLKSIKGTVRISKVNTPGGEDVNSLLDGHEAEIFQHLIDKRTFLFQPDPRSDNGSNGSNEVEQASSFALDVSNPEYLKWQRHGIRFTVVGGIAWYPLDRMKVTLRIKRMDSDHPLHSLRQSLDLYQDDVVEKLARKIAERLEMGSTKVLQALLELTSLLEQYRERENERRRKKEVKKRELTPQRVQTAKAFLSAKKLHQRTNEAIGKTGMIGEKKNRMSLWYIFTSRLREKPLHVMCLGASGTGKTYLQSKIGALIPEHHKKEITAMSDNAVYYFEEKELVHKLLLIEDLDGANEQKILYALRELMSKTQVSKTIVIKDSKGNHKTISLNVYGPICLAGTTTKERLYEDNSNRSLLIYLDNSKAHREAIMDYQRKESAGKINKYEEREMVEFLKDVQSVLQPIKVVNPYAEALKIPEEVFKPLRTNSHYIQFIETVTFYHQYQREKKYDERGSTYIETTIEDIEIANDLLKEILLAKSDELTKASRRFYESLKAYLTKEKLDSFYSSEFRKTRRIAPTTLKRHLRILTKYGYIKIVSGSKNKGYEYELNEEVKDLKASVYTALDEVLEGIKKGLKNNKE